MKEEKQIKELAKVICEVSGCSHKCPSTDKCIVDEEAEAILDKYELIPKRNKLSSTLKNDNKVSEDKYFTPEEVRKMTPKEVKENYDLIIQSMKRWE